MSGTAQVAVVDMRIPMKVDYAVRALVDLGQHDDEAPVRTAEIAARQNVPEAYLDQVLTALNKFGYIRSRRGPQGGHQLARPAVEITLSDVLATLEGRSAPLDCIDDSSECVLSGTCAQRDIWRGVEDAIQAVLRGTTIADLIARQPRALARAVAAGV